MSQAAEIRRLYEQGVQQKEIARILSCSRNSVSRSICDYRRKTGRMIAPRVTMPRADSLPPDIEDMSEFCQRNYHRSVEGARKALEAMNAQ